MADAPAVSEIHPDRCFITDYRDAHRQLDRFKLCVRNSPAQTPFHTTSSSTVPLGLLNVPVGPTTYNIRRKTDATGAHTPLSRPYELPPLW